MNKGGFSIRLKNMSSEQCIFERVDVFWTKYEHESYMFFRDWTHFEQNIGERAVIFS